MQEVNSTKDHAPTVIVYSEDQIKDISFFFLRNLIMLLGRIKHSILELHLLHVSPSQT